MPRYYFNFRIGREWVLDHEGSDLPDLDAANAEAAQNARDLMSDAVRMGFDTSHRTYTICDDTGFVLSEVTFASSVQRRD